MNGFQKAVLWIAGGLTGLLALVVVVRLNSIDPNGALTVLASLIAGLVGSAVIRGNGKDKE